MTTEITGMKTNNQNDKLRDDVLKTANALGDDGKSIRPDFKEFIPEIQKVREENPNLSITDVYNLVKSRLSTSDPVRMKTNKEKYWPVIEEKPEYPGFGGLAPQLIKSKISASPEFSCSSAQNLTIGLALRYHL